jgi:hypothetical protein
LVPTPPPFQASPACRLILSFGFITTLYLRQRQRQWKHSSLSLAAAMARLSLFGSGNGNTPLSLRQPQRHDSISLAAAAAALFGSGSGSVNTLSLFGGSDTDTRDSGNTLSLRQWLSLFGKTGLNSLSSALRWQQHSRQWHSRSHWQRHSHLSSRPSCGGGDRAAVISFVDVRSRISWWDLFVGQFVVQQSTNNIT